MKLLSCSLLLQLAALLLLLLHVRAGASSSSSSSPAAGATVPGQQAPLLHYPAPVTGSSSSDDDAVQTTTTMTTTTVTVTLVDVLSHDPDFSYLIRLLQRARLIPTLNKLTAATLFAPTDAAFKEYYSAGGSAGGAEDGGLPVETVYGDYGNGKDKDQDDDNDNDNLQYRLRERLFYHLLNYTLPNYTDPSSTALSSSSSSDHDNRIHFETTLLFPTTHEEHGRPGHVPYPAPQDTLLGGEGQKLVLKLVEAEKDSPAQLDLLIGVDQDGRGGARAVAGKGGRARNGQVIAIDRVLRPPKSLARQLKARTSDPNGTAAPDRGGDGLYKFTSLLTEDVWNNLTSGSHITLFAPQDKAFDALDPLEWKYLQSGFAADDIVQIALNHQTQFADTGRDRVGYLGRLLDKSDVSLMSGEKVRVESKADRVTVNDSRIVTSDILASNGVMHIVDSLLLPYGSLALTPEKYLLALNATRFVSLFRDNDLSRLLRSSPHDADNNAAYTILATKDDVLERMEELPWLTLPPTGSRELKETLQYHVLEGKWTKKHLKDGRLLSTMLKTDGLGGQNQRIAVSVSRDDDGDHSPRDGRVMGLFPHRTAAAAAAAAMADLPDAEIGFGNANVIAEPVEVGNCIIYLISRILEPPPTFIASALDKGLSTWVASIYASALDTILQRHSPATAFLAATNKAFEFMGLTMNYLLLSSAREELAQLLKYHAIKGIVYLEDLSYDSQHFPTLEGSDVFMERSKKNASSRVRVRGPRIGGFPANGDTRTGKVLEGDILTSTGVLHVIDQVELPPTLNITSEKLMRGARASTFPDLLRQTNLSWIMEGRPAPKDADAYFPFVNLNKADKERIKKSLFKHESYTILCPTDKAFTRINLTHYLSDPASLLSLVQLHIIPSPPPSRASLADPLKFPNDGKPLALTDEASFSTLLSKSQGGPSKYGDLAFRRAGESDWLVGIKGARGTNGKHDNARILNFGRNTPRFAPSDRDDGGGSNGSSSSSSSSNDGGNKGQGPDSGSSSSSNSIIGSSSTALRPRTDIHTDLVRPRMIYGGGVLLIDGVLEPYVPGWMQRWGYIVVIVFLSLALATCIGLLGWKLWDRRRKNAAHYEALRQDNEED